MQMFTFADEHMLRNAKKVYIASLIAMIEFPTLIPCNDDQRAELAAELARVEEQKGERPRNDYHAR